MDWVIHDDPAIARNLDDHDSLAKAIGGRWSDGGLERLRLLGIEQRLTKVIVVGSLLAGLKQNQATLAVHGWCR